MEKSTEDQQALLSQIKGCLAGAAIAGAGDDGLITDDTQMALFTAEGLILSRVRADYSGDDAIPEAVYHSLLRWVYTQQTGLISGMVEQYGTCSIVDGILMGHRELFELRDPSGTCLKALSAGKMGTFEYPPNNSRGPGALARNLPVGLVFKNSDQAFSTASRCAAITHGHPSAPLAAGFLSSLVCEIICGNPLEEALEAAIELLKTHEGHTSLLEKIYQAKNLSMRLRPHTLSMSEFFPEKSAMDVLSKTLFFAMTYKKDYSKALEMARQNDSGTEACEIAGGILGALHGFEKVNNQGGAPLELGHLVVEIAEDLFERFHG